MAGLNISAAIIADQRLLQPERGSSDMPGQTGPAIEPWIKICAAELDEIILVGADPVALLAWDRLIVSDHFETPGLLSGIHAGVFAARRDHVFVTAGTLPVPSALLLALMWHSLDPRCDALVLETEFGVQPLPAIFARRSLKVLSKQLAKGEVDPRRFLRQLRIQPILEKQWRACDPAWAPYFQEKAENRWSLKANGTSHD
ncbi:MAG: NTP transferase domain-containing protein [Desulfobacteraceae bacterium]|nr:NTP transferase domain-containing protein [Desulfobacteraceae bacterium]